MRVEWRSLQVGLDGLEERGAGALDPLAAEAAENRHRDTGSDMTVTVGGGAPGFIVQLRHDFSRPTMRAVLVGRQTELRLLRALLAEGRPVVVYGEAGVGKTALVRAAAEAAELELVEAGALATLSWLPYLPLRRALGREPHGADAAYVARELIEAVGDAILLLDDLQWADAQTRETVPFLAGRLRSSRRFAGSAPRPRRSSASSSARASSAWSLSRSTRTLRRPWFGGSDRISHRRSPNVWRPARAATRCCSKSSPARASRPRASSSRSRHAFVLLDDDSRLTLGLLALLGRPLDAAALPAADELVATGLLQVVDGAIAFRHPLLAEVVAGRLGDEERRSLHARAARVVDHPGEAARHHAAAGERALAHERALAAAEAAERPGELAAHLEVAAACADGADAEVLRLRAASLLVEVGRFAAAERLLDEITTTTRRRGRNLPAACSSGDRRPRPRPRAHAPRRGARSAAGSGTQVEVELGVERVTAELEIDDETAAESVLTEARRLLDSPKARVRRCSDPCRDRPRASVARRR